MNLPEISLTLVRKLPAPPQKVFAAWTDVSLLQCWFGPGKVTVEEASLDLRVGGRYRIRMRDTEGTLRIVGGEYREIVPDRRLVKTWQWEGSELVTLVTVELRDDGNGLTELQLTHSRFDGPDNRDAHHRGWSGGIDNLEALLRQA